MAQTSPYKVNPQDWIGFINNAYKNLGQPATDTPHPEQGKDILGNDVGDRWNTSNKFATDLANTYVNEYYNKKGTIPSEDEVNKFLADNGTLANAQKYVQGQLNGSKITGLASDYLTTQDQLASSNTNATSLPNALQQYADQQYQYGLQNLGQDVQDVYAPQKQGLVEDLASQNQLGQANSQYSLNALEASKNKELNRGITNLLNSRAQTMTNLGVTGAQMAQQNNQFGLNYGLQKQGMANDQDLLAYNQGMQRENMEANAAAARQQASANQPGTLDYLQALSPLIPFGVGQGLSAGIGAYNLYNKTKSPSSISTSSTYSPLSYGTVQQGNTSYNL